MGRRGTYGYSLVVDVAVLGLRLVSVLKIFSNINNSMILFSDSISAAWSGCHPYYSCKV